MTHHLLENNHMVNIWLIFIDNGDQMSVEEILKMWKEKKNCQPITLYSGKIPFQKWGQKSIHLQIKTKRIVAILPDL